MPDAAGRFKGISVPELKYQRTRSELEEELAKLEADWGTELDASARRKLASRYDGLRALLDRM